MNTLFCISLISATSLFRRVLDMTDILDALYVVGYYRALMDPDNSPYIRLVARENITRSLMCDCGGTHINAGVNSEDIKTLKRIPAMDIISGETESGYKLVFELEQRKNEMLGTLKSNRNKYDTEYLYYLIRFCIAHGSTWRFLSSILDLISAEQSRYNLYLMIMKFIYLYEEQSDYITQIKNVTKICQSEKACKYIAMVALDLRSNDSLHHLWHLQKNLKLINQNTVWYFMNDQFRFVLSHLITCDLSIGPLVINMLKMVEGENPIDAIVRKYIPNFHKHIAPDELYSYVITALVTSTNQIYLILSIYIILYSDYSEEQKNNVQELLSHETAQFVGILNRENGGEIDEFLTQHPAYLNNEVLFKFICHFYYSEFLYGFNSESSVLDTFSYLMYEAHWNFLSGITSITQDDMATDSHGIFNVKECKFAPIGTNPLHAGALRHHCIKISVHNTYLVHYLVYVKDTYALFETILEMAPIPMKNALEGRVLQLDKITQSNYLFYLIKNNIDGFKHFVEMGIEVPNKITDLLRKMDNNELIQFISTHRVEV